MYKINPNIEVEKANDETVIIKDDLIFFLKDLESAIFFAAIDNNLENLVINFKNDYDTEEVEEDIKDFVNILIEKEIIYNEI